MKTFLATSFIALFASVAVFASIYSAPSHYDFPIVEQWHCSNCDFSGNPEEQPTCWRCGRDK